MMRTPKARHVESCYWLVATVAREKLNTSLRSSTTSRVLLLVDYYGHYYGTLYRARACMGQSRSTQREWPMTKIKSKEHPFMLGLTTVLFPTTTTNNNNTTVGWFQIKLTILYTW